MRWLRKRLCRHIRSSVSFHLDGRAPGWSWKCHTCGKSRDLA